MKPLSLAKWLKRNKNQIKHRFEQCDDCHGDGCHACMRMGQIVVWRLGDSDEYDSVTGLYEHFLTIDEIKINKSSFTLFGD